MACKHETTKKVEEFIIKSASEGVTKIYPNEIRNKLNLSMTEVLVALHRLFEEGKIELKYEVKCSICKQVETYPDDDGICDNCGEKLQMEPKYSIPVYHISRYYFK